MWPRFVGLPGRQAMHELPRLVSCVTGLDVGARLTGLRGGAKPAVGDRCFTTRIRGWAQ